GQAVEPPAGLQERTAGVGGGRVNPVPGALQQVAGRRGLVRAGVVGRGRQVRGGSAGAEQVAQAAAGVVGRQRQLAGAGRVVGLVGPVGGAVVGPGLLQQARRVGGQRPGQCADLRERVVRLPQVAGRGGRFVLTLVLALTLALAFVLVAALV